MRTIYFIHSQYVFVFCLSWIQIHESKSRMLTLDKDTISMLVDGKLFLTMLMRLREYESLYLSKQLEPIQCNLIRFMKYKYLIEVFLFIYLIISTELVFGKMQLLKFKFENVFAVCVIVSNPRTFFLCSE